MWSVPLQAAALTRSLHHFVLSRSCVAGRLRRLSLGVLSECWGPVVSGKSRAVPFLFFVSF